jgi:hypothetical protein
MLDKLYFNNFDNYENYDDNNYIDLINSLKGNPSEFFSINHLMDHKNFNSHSAEPLLIFETNNMETSFLNNLSSQMMLKSGPNLVIVFYPRSNDIIYAKQEITENPCKKHESFFFSFLHESGFSVIPSTYIRSNIQRGKNFSCTYIDPRFIEEMEITRDPMIIKFKEFESQKSVKQEDLKEWKKSTSTNYYIYLKIIEKGFPYNYTINEKISKPKNMKKASSEKAFPSVNNFRIGNYNDLIEINTTFKFPKISIESGKALSLTELNNNVKSK